MSSRKPLRVLHALHDVGGNASGLAAAERELGLDSVAVTLRQQSYGYRSDRVLCERSDGYLVQEYKRWRLFGEALRRFDVVHFNFGRSIAPPWKGWGSSAGATNTAVLRGAGDMYLRATWQRDVPLLKAAGKRIFADLPGRWRAARSLLPAAVRDLCRGPRRTRLLQRTERWRKSGERSSR